MKLVVGLGNPGEKYAHTRHNVGFMFVDEFQKKVDSKEYRLLKPHTFMNKSGEEVAREARYYKIASKNIVVIHDDLDISLGLWKKQVGVGPKLHYGIQSIEQQLGTKEFVRIRIGIDNRSTENRISGEAYVLQQFTAEEENTLREVFREIIFTLRIGGRTL